MRRDDFRVQEDIHVELLQENLLEEADALTRIKPLKVVLSGQNEGQGLILVLQVDHHFDLFRLHVQNAIAEVHEDQALAILLRVPELLPDEEAVLVPLSVVVLVITFLAFCSKFQILEQPKYLISISLDVRLIMHFNCVELLC